MHELSIVQSLVELCNQQVLKNNLLNEDKKIKEVIVKIGVLSGVEPHYLKSAFDVYKIQTICQEAKLSIIHQPILVKCSSCGFMGELKNNEFICPSCNKDELDVIDGEDMHLMRLVIE